jgi:hypothetical protein
MNSVIDTARRTALIAVGFGALASMIGCADVPEPSEDEVLSSDEIAYYDPYGGTTSTYNEPTFYTKTTTEEIIPPQICHSRVLSAKDLQKRASAVFDYLIGSSTLPSSTYACTNGSLDYAKLNAIRNALGYSSQTANIKNCFHTTQNNCNVSGVKSARHVLTYVGTDTAVVNALKTLAANVDGCWHGAGTWMQPAKPAVPVNFEGPASNNFGEDCRYKEAYLTTTETYYYGSVISRSYKIGCYRTDPEPAQLQTDLNLNANGNMAWAKGANTGTWTPFVYSYQNTWRYDPNGPPAGAPCVSQQAMSAMMGYTVEWWMTNWFANNYMQVSGSYRRCMTQS